MKLIDLKDKFSNNESFVLLLGSALLSIFSFLITIILSRNLPITIYGELKQILLYGNLIITFATAGFSQAIYYYLNRSDYRFSHNLFVKQIRIFQGVLLVIFCFFFLTFYVYFRNLFFFNFTDLSAVLIFILFSGFAVIDLNLSIYYRKFPLFLMVNGLIQIIRAAIFLVLSFTESSITYILLTNAVLQVINVICNKIILKEKYFGERAWAINFSVQKKIIAYALPLFLSNISSFFIANTGKFILIFNSNNPTNFAILSNVTFDVPFIGNVYLSFFTIALPSMISAFENKDFNKLLYIRFEYIRKVTILILPISIAIIIWHKDFITIFFGKSYSDFSYLFSIYSLIGILRICSHHDILLSTNHTKAIFYFQFVELIAQIFLSLFLYNIFGIKGLVIATVLINYVYILLVNIWSARILNVGFGVLFPFSFLTKQLLVHIFSALFFKLIFNRFLPTSSFLFPLLLWIIFVLIINREHFRKYLT